LALSSEFTTKALYAQLIGLLAGLSPAELHIQSVVRGADNTGMTADPQIKLIRQIDNQNAVIETPRYRVFTEILIALSTRGDDVVEIAGNDDVLVTVRAHHVSGRPGAVCHPDPVAARMAACWVGRQSHEVVAPDTRTLRFAGRVRACLRLLNTSKTRAIFDKE